MKTRSLALIIVILSLLANSATAYARQASDLSRQWAAVRALPSGDKVSVRLKDGKKVEGTLRSVSDTMLTVDRGSSSTDLHRDSIAKVYQVIQKSRGKSVAKGALIGAGIGFGAGAGVAFAAGNYEDLETAELVGILGGLGAAIGAGLGALFSSFGKKQEQVLVYESR
jgi:small nuclear ribonucleoprotein (snRNP)-like protein